MRDVYGDSVDKIVQGNANWVNAKLATPHGWVRMKDIAVGDEVYTPDGKPTRVLGVYPKGVRPVYKVTLRDGSSTLVCNQHLWEVERWKSSLRYTGERDEDGHRKYVGTGENGKTSVRVSEVIDTDELKRRVDSGMGVDLPLVKPVEYPDAVLPMDPYVLGVILGDAHVDMKGHVLLTCTDAPILDELSRRGYAATLNASSVGKSPVYYIKGVAEIMRNLGLAGHRAWEKFIPSAYLFGSVQQRIDLLRGLMDTDGYISKKSEMEFVSTSETLARDVQELIRSLGGRVAVNEKTNIKYTSPNQAEPKEARTAYRVQNIRLPEINPFFLPRKASRWHDRDKATSGNYGNRVVSVEYMFDDEVQCILVEDERHLFLVDDYIPTHNTSNIVFLKSTDDSMLDTLQKMSGTRHVTYGSSKSVTVDKERMFMQVEGKVSVTYQTAEEPVISYNDFAFIAERNSIVLRAGDSPIWNRNEMILPMSWRLFKNTIQHAGHDYSLQTIPTLSSALDFDVRKNQPDFMAMLERRKEQAYYAAEAEQLYKEAYGYTDAEFERLDPDIRSDNIMDIIDDIIYQKHAAEAAVADETSGESAAGGSNDGDDYYDDEDAFAGAGWEPEIEDNTEQIAATAEAQKAASDWSKSRYADRQLSREELVSQTSGVQHEWDKEILTAYHELKSDFWRDVNFFSHQGDDLYSADGRTLYICKNDMSDDYQKLQKAAKDKNSRVYSEDPDADSASAGVQVTYEVTDDFYRFLVSLPNWSFARGRFDKEMARMIRAGKK